MISDPQKTASPHPGLPTMPFDDRVVIEALPRQEDFNRLKALVNPLHPAVWICNILFLGLIIFAFSPSGLKTMEHLATGYTGPENVSKPRPPPVQVAKGAHISELGPPMPEPRAFPEFGTLWFWVAMGCIGLVVAAIVIGTKGNDKRRDFVIKKAIQPFQVTFGNESIGIADALFVGQVRWEAVTFKKKNAEVCALFIDSSLLCYFCRDWFASPEQFESLCKQIDSRLKMPRTLSVKPPDSVSIHLPA